MEAWGGIECSINRVGESYFDQLGYDQLYDRPELLEHILGLGIKTLRFPVLWEKMWPDEHKAPDWAVEKQLELLKKNQVRVIAGLVHHGSGPRYSSVQDGNFPEKLALYARMVAAKFPWINDYTPVNEPLTTARFCGLYGLWHPHSIDDSAFLNILVNECRATVLAMQAIREVNPGARLVFTEDLTKIHGTQELKAQTVFENQRRWLSIDLICGKVGPTHLLWKYLTAQGIGIDQLFFFIQNPMPPDVLGFNYYVTSERYLDHRLDQHPPACHGGNGQMAYADIEAVRHPDARVSGPANLMREAWQRYKLPMAITEAHLCCGREDQLRWLKSIWDDCTKLQAEGIHLMAVTFWSLFGAYGWDKLLVKKKGAYESGAFDLSSGWPRPTAIAHFISALTQGQPYQSPVIDGKGWWQRQTATTIPSQPILIIGGSGTLGAAFYRICTERNISCVAPDRKQLNISNCTQIKSAILQYDPWAVINAAGYVQVDAAQQEVEDCLLANTTGPLNLAKACSEKNIQFLNFSSDLVFDGSKQMAYCEDDPVNPINIYGYSKAQAEQYLLAQYPSALIIRTSAFFGPWDSYNFVSMVLDSLKHSRPFSAMDDVTITATYVPHLVHASLDLLMDRENGIWHLSNKGVTSWYELAVTAAERAGYEGASIRRISRLDADLPAERPVNSALESRRGQLMPTLMNGLDEYFRQKMI